MRNVQTDGNSIVSEARGPISLSKLNTKFTYQITLSEHITPCN